MLRILISVLSISIVLNLEAEVFPDKQGFDSFGGYLSIKGEETGRFSLDVIDGRHYLVTPEGHGFLSIGVTHTRGIEFPEDSRMDLFKKAYESNWNLANKDLINNFRKWGYNSLGYGSNESTREFLPYFESCDPTEKTNSWRGKLIEFPDVFSDEWKERSEFILNRMVSRIKHKKNLIGIYWGDMPSWDIQEAKRVVGKSWVDTIRELPIETAGRKRYEKFLKDHGENASDEDFLVLIARELYSHIGPLTRKLAPDTLIFGERYAGRSLPWRVIKEALPWIDVVSVQPHEENFPIRMFEKLYRETDKPVMICDHQASFNTPEHSKVMWKTLSNVASVAKAHHDYLKQGFATPYLIGYNRCQYIDRFKAKQGALKQGIIQVDGKPYTNLAKTIELNNWTIHNKFIKIK